MVALAGWGWMPMRCLKVMKDTDQRVLVMRQGALRLSEITGLGFSCDLALWRGILMDPAAESDFGYRHP